MILIEDLAYVTLIDEDTKSILTDDANKEIPSNMTMLSQISSLFRSSTKIRNKRSQQDLARLGNGAPASM